MTFPKPPIIEAMFYVGVELDSSFTVSMLDSYRDSITDQFPRAELLVSKTIPFNFVNIDPIPEEEKLKEHGYRLWDLNNKKVVNVNIDNFSFSQLEPYSEWDSFFSESYNLWEKYIELTNVNKISQLSLRYLNRILIPFSEGYSFLLEDYIQIFPQLPEKLSMSISQYVMQVSFFSEKYTPSQSVIRQASSEIFTDENHQDFVPIIFDIQVYQNVDLDSKDANSIKEIFSSNLRKFKNDIFYQSITEKSRGLFKND